MSTRKTLLILFRIWGDLCYLSHRETLTLWQRVCSRARVPLAYSGGFNPRPRLSLPLPRPVGLQSDEELLCCQLAEDVQADADEIAATIAPLLPDGCDITEVRIEEGKRKYAAKQAEYLFVRSQSVLIDEWTGRIDRCTQTLACGKSIPILRTNPKRKSKTLDLRDFIEEVTGNQNELHLQCRVGPDGSARLNELAEWIGVGPDDLAVPPCRRSVVWIQN